MIVYSLVSTPLHFFLASALAVEEKDKEHHLIFIDQVDVENNLYYQVVGEWTSSPFKTISIFPGRTRGFLKKYQLRQHIFKSISDKVKAISPDEVRVGNDRRIEFQFLMHCAKKTKPNVIGSYLDEGFFTYMGREASTSFGDRIVDTLAKKIAYGFWWTTPPTVGASRWVNKAYVAFPSLVHEQIKKKELIEINKAAFNSDAMKSLSALLMARIGVDCQQLQSIDYLFALPHESIYQKDEAYRDKLIVLIKLLVSHQKNVAIKYHPRDLSHDGLNLSTLDHVSMIPGKANFEALISQLPQCHIVGDVSSVLLTAKWLRDDLSILALIAENSPPNLIELYQKLSIKTKKIDEIGGNNLVEI